MGNDSFTERLTVTKNYGPDKGMAKISVNMNPATLAAIDLLVDQGHYSNRSDFINHAVRDALQLHQPIIDLVTENQRSMRGRQWFLGIFGLTAADVSALREDDPVSIRGYGILTIDKNCDEEKLFACVKSIEVRGKVSATATVKAHYGL